MSKDNVEPQWSRDDDVDRVNVDDAWTAGINYKSDIDRHDFKINVHDWDKERAIRIADKIVEFLNENKIEGGK